MDKNELLDRIITETLARKPKSASDFLALKEKIAKGAKGQMPNVSEMRERYHELITQKKAAPNADFERLLTRRGVRSISGVAVVTVLTKPYPCPGHCTYCPDEARMPKSYLSNEPAAARALDAKFDPFVQVTRRLAALVSNGHAADKIELIVKGGTWSSYPWAYRQWFIRRCFDAANSFGQPRRRTERTLLAAQLRNESADFRIIGMTLETRPDRITVAETVRLRELGCTRVELGVQSTEDAVLTKVKRGHDVESVRQCAWLLRSAGFKVDFHLMPQLPGATPESDLESIRTTFTDPGLKPDMIKIYPCTVIAGTELHEDLKAGRYVPYSDRELFEMLIGAKTLTPRYCRISRLIRDIPSTSIEAGNRVTNLRQHLQTEMAKRGLHCKCLRCREVGRAVKEFPGLKRSTPRIFDDRYTTLGGEEHFLSFEDTARHGVFAFCRLRLPKQSTSAKYQRLMNEIPELRGAAIIRELHTYGLQIAIGGQDERSTQHKGLGKKLMQEAERIARQNGYKKMAVISGVGVRGYYRKLGYRRQGTYMVKSLKAGKRV